MTDRFETAKVKGDRLHQRLHADIVSGRMPPGERLSETRLAEQYAISRTPVREVLRRLLEEGLLRVVPQIGTYVAPIHLASVRDSQFIRETLECRAVRLATENRTQEHCRLLRRYIAQQAKLVAAGDRLAFFASDEAMHRDIMRIADHPSVWDLIASVKAQLDRVRYLSLEDDAWLAMIFSQHRDIVDCIDRRDPGGAEAAMQAHLRTAFGAIERIADMHPDFFEHTAAAHPQKEIA